MHGANAAAHAAAVANAIKASGVVLRVEAGDFLAVLRNVDEPLIVVSQGGVFKKHFKYLTSYKGLAFYTKSDNALVLPSRAEVVHAKAMSIPDV